MTQAYPLQWPPAWPKTPLDKREPGKFKTTLTGAINNLTNEVKLLGGSELLLSSNVTLGDSKPRDAGVAAYFTFDGEQSCIPCDRWKTVEANVQAIAKTIEAMRGIERWGAKHMIKAALRGFQALPAPGAQSCWAVLRLSPDATATSIEMAFRELSKKAHPDAGGSDAAMAELNQARANALAQCKGKR